MDEQARFETRAVLAPKRTRRSRLALLVPALALVATAWAGLSGRSEQGIARESSAAPTTQAIAAAASPVGAEPPGAAEPPAQALGLEVHRLDELDPRRLGSADVLAIAGWYLATEITDCPPLADAFRQTAGPDADRKVDAWRFCQRSGVLFASQPSFDGQPGNDLEENSGGDSQLPAIDVMVDEHVVMPPQLEVLGGDPTAVVVLGRFVDPDERCHWPMDCPRQLVIDHVAWSGG